MDDRLIDDMQFTIGKCSFYNLIMKPIWLFVYMESGLIRIATLFHEIGQSPYSCRHSQTAKKLQEIF